MTPEQRVLRGRMGGLTAWSRHGADELLGKAWQANATRWENEVDPERLLPADERHKRAERAKRAHMTKLALLSAQARARKKAR